MCATAFILSRMILHRIYSVYTGQNGDTPNDTAQNILARMILHRKYSVYTGQNGDTQNDTAQNILARMILHRIDSLILAKIIMHKISLHRIQLSEHTKCTKEYIIHQNTCSCLLVQTLLYWV